MNFAIVPGFGLPSGPAACQPLPLEVPIVRLLCCYSSSCSCGARAPTMIAQARRSPVTRSLVAQVVSRRLLSSRPNIRLPKNGSTSISIAAGCLLVGGAATVATVVMCEQDRMERWNARWATGNVVRTLIRASIVHECTPLLLLFVRICYEMSLYCVVSYSSIIRSNELYSFRVVLVLN